MIGLLPEVAAHATTLALLVFCAARLSRNLRFWRQGDHLAPLPVGALPRVSVLVPARNEAEVIEACISSLLAQDYPTFEVLALDDHSTDGTGARLDALRAASPRLRVLHRTDDPPAGWNGKSAACQRLAEAATGDWLLFTDADTVHEPGSLARGVTLARTLDAALLSAFPDQRTGSWSERVLVSFILDFLPLVAVDFQALWQGRSRWLAANGQYLLTRREAYQAIGGHASIHSALVDDFALARRFRDAGYTVALADGRRMLHCRMYRSAREVWGGFAKNLLGALAGPQGGGRAWQAPLFAWSYACLFVVPWLDLARGQWLALALGEIAALYLLRAVVARRLRRPLGETVTTPLAAWGVMALGLTAVIRRWRGRDVEWKGRRYHLPSG